MLDLTQKIKYYQLIWLDGTELHLFPPTLKTYKKLLNMRNNCTEENIDSIYEVISDIVNNNKEGMHIDNVADKLGLDVCVLLMHDYFEYYQKIMDKNVVFQNTQQTNR